MASNYEINYLDKRPQELCKMCGKCCRVVTTSTRYEKLLEMKAQGDQGAIDFLSIFEPYASIEAARGVDNEIVENIITQLQECNNYNEENLTFYRCKHLRDDNMCSNYENRPELCHKFPGAAWAVVPPGCGFEAWLFWKREEDKQKVRRSKEQLLELKLLRTKTSDPEVVKKIEAVEQKIQKTIDMFRKYGAEQW